MLAEIVADEAEEIEQAVKNIDVVDHSIKSRNEIFV